MEATTRDAELRANYKPADDYSFILVIRNDMFVIYGALSISYLSGKARVLSQSANPPLS